MLGRLDALGRSGEKAVMDVMLPVARQAASSGFDPKGGYQTQGSPSGQASTGNKVWWVQAEFLNGLLQLYFLTKDTVHLDRLESTLSFVENRHVDSQYGEWYPEIKPDSTPACTNKGYEWKASYHTLRVALQLDLWIEDYLARDPSAESGGNSPLDDAGGSITASKPPN